MHRVRAWVPSVTKGSYFVAEVSYKKGKMGLLLMPREKLTDGALFFPENVCYIEVPLVFRSQWSLYLGARQHSGQSSQGVHLTCGRPDPPLLTSHDFGKGF